MRPAGKRAVVTHLVEAHGLSERRACRLADLNLSTWQYRARRQDRSTLRERLKELAGQRRRFGYRRLHALLRREGWQVNHKAVHCQSAWNGDPRSACKRDPSERWVGVGCPLNAEPEAKR